MAEAEQAVEVTGADVESAVAAGLARLGVDRDEVDIEVLDEGSRGLFGIGAREVRVRLTARPHRRPTAPAERVVPPPAEPEVSPTTNRDEAEIARGVMLELLSLMDMDRAQVDARWAQPATDEEEPPLVLDVHGPDADVLIGRRGNTLAALQHITRLITGREVEGWVHLVVDVNGFKAHREQSLQRMAQRLAEQAVRTNRTVVLEPMPPHERRYVHVALRDHPQVTTQSVGEGDRRKVTIIPKGDASAGR